MDSSDSVTTPRTLKQRYQLSNKRLSPQKSIVARSGITPQRSPQMDAKQPPLPPGFCGFLGPSSSPGSDSFSKPCSPSKATRRRPDGITVLSRALRQRQPEKDIFPPANSSTELQANLLDSAKRSTIDRCHDSHHNVDSFHRYTHLNATNSRNICANSSKSPRRAISPSSKTQMIKEMLPAVASSHGLKTRCDAQGCESQMILLPINKKIIVTEITDRTDKYKQLAGYRTFSIEFDTTGTQQEDSYKRRPYLLHKPSKEQRRTSSPAQFHSIFTNTQYSGLAVSPNSRENTLPQLTQVRHTSAEEAVDSAGVLEPIDMSQSSNHSKVSKAVGKHQYSPSSPTRKALHVPFPLI